MSVPGAATIAAVPVRRFAGGVRRLPDSGRPTGMVKTPLAGPVAIGPLGFAGDVQADRRVHGGPDKAVHLYPAAHYAVLARHFPEAAAQLVPGSIGENLSAALDEDDVFVGEVWQLGGAQLQVCQPRTPCTKIDERFARDGMAAFIAEHRLTGWYWRVLVAGPTDDGEPLRRLHRDPAAPTLGAAQRLVQLHRPPLAELAALVAVPGIAAGWRERLEQRLRYLSQPDR